MPMFDDKRETELIRANRKTPRALKPHRFQPAQKTLPDLTKRCLVCGERKPTKGETCQGLEALRKADAISEAWETPLLSWHFEDYLLEKQMPGIFKSPGGKRLLAKKLVKMLPPHAVYCEPFCGSAAVFFQKSPAPQEVLSDLREGAMDTYRYIRDTKDFTALFKMNWRPSRTRWEYLNHLKPQTPLMKCYRFLWLSRSSLLNREGEGYSPIMASRNLHVPLKSRFPLWHDRLQGVALLKQDAFKVIAAYDSPYTVFYLDPPYPRGRHANLYPGHEWDMVDCDRLFKLCDSLKGKFLMSLNFASLPDHIPSGFDVQRVKVWYPCLPTSVKHLNLGREGKFRYEVLVKNFK
jgi:DNA adenine methylase